jgi:hypothetical protein
MLDLKRLRQEAYSAWQWLQDAQASNLRGSRVTPLFVDDDRSAYQNDQFKDSIRQQYGDLRCRTTWERAAIDLTAHRISQYYLEPHEIVGYLTSSDYLHCTIRKHYGDRLIEAMLQCPEILEMLQDGLEHLYHVSDDAADREIVLKFARKIARRLFPMPKVRRVA